MRYFYDTEFFERGNNFPIEIISIGMVAEDGRELYMVNSTFDWETVPPVEFSWLFENVKPSWDEDMQRVACRVPKHLMSRQIQRFLGDDAKPELWAYFAAYDHVVFTQLFGRMINQPKNLWITRCLKQEMLRLGVSKDELPQQEGTAHRAIDDARWNQKAYDALVQISLDRGYC